MGSRRIYGLMLFFGLAGTLFGQMNEKRSMKEQNHLIFYASYSPTGKYIITTGSDNNIILWNAETGIIFRTLTGLTKRPNMAVFSGTDDIIFSAGEDGLITQWDVSQVKILSQTEGHKGAIKTMAINNLNTRLVTGGEDNVLRVWDIENNQPKLLYELKGHKKTIYCSDFHPEENKVISGSADKMLILWDIDNGSMIREVQGHNDVIRCVSYSPDGTLIASGGDDKLIRIRGAEDLTEIMVLEGHRDWVKTLSFTPTGKRLISGSLDGTIRMWDLSDGKQLAVSDKLEEKVLSVDVDPVRSDFISSCLYSDKLRIWAYEPSSQGVSQTADRPRTAPDKAGTGDPGVSSQKAIPVREETGTGPEEKAPGIPLITVFSPMTVDGNITHGKNSILIVGKAEAEGGIQSVVVNRQRASLNEAGVFEVEVPLAYGDNPIEIVAVSRTGKMGTGGLTVHCTNETAQLPGEAPAIEQAKYYGLIIGINQYEDESIQDLDYPIQDANTLYETLVGMYSYAPEDITFLKNPTRADIIIALDELAKKVTPRDNLLIFYAGHGTWDEKTGIGAWLPRDATQSNTVNWINNSYLRDCIGSIRSRHTLLIADACFSGSIFKTRAAFSNVDQGIAKLYELPSRKAMTSGALKEVPDQSVFVKYLIKELQNNEAKYLPSEILYGNFKPKVLNNSPNVPQYGTIQNVGDEGGDFIFIRK